MNAVTPEERLHRRVVVAAIAFAGKKIGLAEDDISGLIVLYWRFAPNQNPMVPRIGDRKPVGTSSHARRDVEREAGNISLCIAAFVIKIGLADNKVGRCVVFGRQFFPAKQPMVAGVCDPKRIVFENCPAPRAKDGVGVGVTGTATSKPVSVVPKTTSGLA